MPDRRPNRALLLARKRAEMSRYQLAGRIAAASQGQIGRDAADKTLQRIESGKTKVPSDLYQQLICEVLRASRVELFGRHEADELDSDTFTATCRKYIPVVVPTGAAKQIATTPGMTPTELEGIRVHRTVLDWPHDQDGVLHVTVMPFGVVVAELRQTREFASLAELAVWRHTSYEIDRPRVDALLKQKWPVIVESPQYVLGTWWLARSCWTGDDLDTAVRIMSTPSVLLNRQGTPTAEELLAGAEVAERSLMEDGFNTGDGIIDFGVDGVACGYASWSGIAYAPLAVDRALHPDELGNFETLCQGLWAVCDSVCSTVEAGHDPVVEDGYGWRWLRGITTRITRPRPTETRQVRAMRDAVVETSALGQMLPETISILRDVTPIST